MYTQDRHIYDPGLVRDLGFLWCGVVRGLGHRHPHHHHRHHHVPFLGQLPQEVGLTGTRWVTVAFSIPSWQSPGWKVSPVTRIGCVWDEILVTVYGFGDAMWEQSQGFGTFGPGRARVGGGGGGGIPWGGGGRRTEKQDHIYI